MPLEIIELSEKEIAERSQRLAAKIAEHDEVTAEKKESAKEFAQQLTDLNQEIRELSNVVRSGKEYRQSKGLFTMDTDQHDAM